MWALAFDPRAVVSREKLAELAFDTWNCTEDMTMIRYLLDIA